ncbi:MAG: hypothetical protein QOD59_1097 [Mycobacterium sp.]|nr:hypothetical protein [Mycobacterium sp.]
MAAGNDDGGTACAEDRSVYHTILQLMGTDRDALDEPGQLPPKRADWVSG